MSKSYEYTHGVLEYVAGHQTLVSQRQSGSSTSYPAGTNVYIPYRYDKSPGRQGGERDLDAANNLG